MLKLSFQFSIVTNEECDVLFQALWRGYILRKRLQLALDYARLEESSDDDDDFFKDEIDMSAFNFNEVGSIINNKDVLIE